MLIEHSFVTTLPAQQAFTEASNMLVTRGFSAVASGAFAMDQGAWTRLEMTRGDRKRRSRSDLTKFPQRVLLEYDRGRITVAAAIEPLVVQRSFSLGYSSLYGGTNLAKPGKKQAAEFERLLTAIVESVERLLVDRTEPAAAVQAWADVETQIQERARRTRRNSLIFLLIFVFVIVGLVVTLIAIAMKH